MDRDGLPHYDHEELLLSVFSFQCTIFQRTVFFIIILLILD